MATQARDTIERLRQGDHVCLLYEEQAEYLDALVSFHRRGLAAGNRCIHIADAALTSATLAALRDAGVDMDREVRRGAFLSLGPEDLYLKRGAFDPESVLSFWRETQGEALRAGFKGLHISGDVTWLVDNHAPGLERFGEYEVEVNRAIAESRIRALCCYNRRLLPANVLANMFRAHRQVVFGERVLYPDLLVHSSGDGAPSDDWLEALLQRLRESEDALRNSLDVKEQLLEVLPAAIYTCNADGLITSFNQTAAELWRRWPALNDPSERFCGSYRLYSPDGQSLLHHETPMSAALRDGIPRKDVEVVIERPDGSRVTALANIAPIRDGQGRVTGAVNCLVDISGRKRTESMLRQRTREYYRLLENLPAAAYTCDSDGLITYFNQHAVRIWGREPKLNDPEDRFCGSLKLFWPDGSPMRHDECWMARALQTDEAYNGYEVIIERSDGSRVTALAHANPLFDEEGRPAGAVNVLVDITERRRAEETQRLLNQQLANELDGARRLQETSTQLIQTEDPDALNRHILDAATGIMSSDMASMQIFHAERGELQLLEWRGVDPESAAFWEGVGPETGSACGEALRTGRRVVVADVETCGFIVGVNLEAFRKAGIRAVQSTPLLSRSGRMLGMISTHWRRPHQPTERDLRLLDVLARQAADLIERSQAEEALREADRRKDEFLAMLSHELRNPLAPIANALELLDGADDGDREEVVGVLKRQVDTMARLVDDLLDVSRVTTGRIELQHADLELNELVRSTADSFRRRMAEGGHKFSVSLAGEPLWVRGDATRLEQVVVNLLSNSAKYTPDGGRVWLSVERAGQPQGGGDEAVIRVKDSGMGMEPDLLPRVFELFSQGKQTLDRRHAGLGLGLSLVKSLVEMHRGTVRAASEGPGRGSEFTVRLPLRPSPPEGEPGPAPSADNHSEHRSGGLRLLVVDDNAAAGAMMAMLLRRKGYEVLTAQDGPAAVQAAVESRPDVVLLDIGLPGMDGYEVARRIRAEDALHRTVLVAMTGYGQAEDLRRSREAGFDHHLVKPADTHVLQRILAAVADSKQ